MSSSGPADPMGRDAILEANLQALFARAYAPVPIRAGFADEVARCAAAALGRAPRSRPRALTLALAAAASFLLAALAFALWQRSDFARERILGRGELAVRQDHGAWRASAGAQLALGARALELAVPAGLEAAVACAPGAVALLGPARAVLVPGEGGAAIDLESGGVALRGFQGRVRGEFGSFECSSADLDLACDDAGAARARLGAGRARFESRDGRREELVRGQRFDTRPAAPAGAAVLLGSAPPAPGDARRPLPPPGVPAPPPAEPRAPLSGTVRDGSGRALEKFSVILLREVELPQTSEPSARAFEAAAGRFRFDAVEPGDWTVFVHAEGLALATREHVRIGASDVALEFVLQAGAAVEGRVVEAGSGRPLANVVLVSEADVPASLLPFALADCVEHPDALARSDAEGRFRFDHLAARPTVVRACLPGYGASWSAVLVPGAQGGELALELSAGGSLAGRVEREDGSPATDAAVIAMPQRTILDSPRRSYGFGVTDAGGAYRVGDLPAGDYVAVRIELAEAASAASRPRAPRAEVREVRISAGVEQRVDFLAPPRGSRLAGRVLRADREPLAAATVSIMPVDAAPASGGVAPLDWRSQLCSASGTFEFTDVVPGTYEIYLGVRTPMDIVLVDKVEVGGAANVDREILATGGELSGRVRAAATGRGIGFAVIIVEREAPGASCAFVAKVFTDESGGWRVPYLADGSYRVRVYPGQGFALAGRDGLAVGAAGASAPLELELVPGASCTLTVRDERSAPLSGIEVRLFDERGLEYEPARESRTDRAGRFTLEGLPAGRSRLLLRAADGATLERWIVAEPPQAQSLEIRMSGAKPASDGK